MKSHFIKASANIFAHKMVNKNELPDMKLAKEDAEEADDNALRRAKGKASDH